MQTERNHAFISQAEADERNFADPEFVRAYNAAEADVELLPVDVFSGSQSQASEFYAELMDAMLVNVRRQDRDCLVRFEKTAYRGSVQYWLRRFLRLQRGRTVAPVKFYQWCNDAVATTPVRVRKEGENLWMLSLPVGQGQPLEDWLNSKTAP